VKKKPSSWGARLAGIKAAIEPERIKRSLLRLLDDGFVRLGILPAMMDGSGKILHLSDTPTVMYGHLARVLRRVDPAVVIHTGDLADDIKLEMYPAEAARYAASVRRLINILLAPHRRVIITLGNHDRADLLPPLPPQCVVCGGALSVTLFGTGFRVSHYSDMVTNTPERYNLFGHDPCLGSFVDDEGRYFFNGIEIMRIIDPANDDIKFLAYPGSARAARQMRCGRCAK
jgi:hypothetical protein